MRTPGLEMIRTATVLLLAGTAATVPTVASASPAALDAVRRGAVATADSTPFEQVYVRGTFNEWGLTPMRKVEGTTNTWTADVYEVRGEDRFKFDVHGDWTENYGASGEYHVTARNGGGIAFPAGMGSYTVTFDGTTKEWGIRPVGFTSTHPSMYVRGTFNNSGLGGMTLAADGLWTTAVWLTPGARLKFDVYGTWATSYGDDGADDALARNGADIVATTPGFFRVTFDEKTSRYALTQIR